MAKTAYRHYGMYSLAGNSKVRSLVVSVRNGLEAGTLTQAEEVRDTIYKSLNVIDAAGYPEVWDTAVRDAIWSDIFKICTKHGIPEEDFFN